MRRCREIVTLLYVATRCEDYCYWMVKLVLVFKVGMLPQCWQKYIVSQNKRCPFILLDVVRFCWFLAETYQKEHAIKWIFAAHHILFHVLNLYLVKLAKQHSGIPHLRHDRVSGPYGTASQFIFPDLRPPNSPDLYPVVYEVCDVMQEHVYRCQYFDVANLNRAWLLRDPSCSN